MRKALGVIAYQTKDTAEQIHKELETKGVYYFMARNLPVEMKAYPDWIDQDLSEVDSINELRVTVLFHSDLE